MSNCILNIRSVSLELMYNGDQRRCRYKSNAVGRAGA